MGGSDATATVIAVAASACLPDAKPGQCLRHTVASSLRVLVERRKALVCKYPITGAEFPCLEEHSAESVADVWGAPAHPADPALHHKAMLRVWRRTMKVRISMTTKEALADKEYRRRGGKFAFPSPMDTFVRGLHQRTADLHADWRERLGRETSGDDARNEAVAEMLLRLRWDDNDDRARAQLSRIIGRIWDGLEGVDLKSAPPIASALWLDERFGTEHLSLTAGAIDEGAAAPCDYESTCALEETQGHHVNSTAPFMEAAQVPSRGDEEQCAMVGRVDVDCDIPRATEEMQGAEFL